MNQIVTTLISALGLLRNQATHDLHSNALTPMAELDVTTLAHIVGGDGDDQGPRGGWKAVAMSAA